MKTIEELCKAVLADNDLKAQCAEAIKAQKLDEFLKAQGCGATAEEVKAFLESKKEVSVDELDDTAGGCNGGEALLSAATMGFGCIAAKIMSTTSTRQESGLNEITDGMKGKPILC